MTTSSHRRSPIAHRGLVAALLLAALGAWCTRIPKGQCVFNADCEENQVCANRYCRQQCNGSPNISQEVRDRDCPAGYTCRPGDNAGPYACYPPNTPYRCVYHSECNQMRQEICARDGFCRSQCVSNYDCVVLTGSRSSTCLVDAGGVCDFRFEDAGVDDASSSDAATDRPADGG